MVDAVVEHHAPLSLGLQLPDAEVVPRHRIAARAAFESGPSRFTAITPIQSHNSRSAAGCMSRAIRNRTSGGIALWIRIGSTPAV